jgi:hypothetical protein
VQLVRVRRTKNDLDGLCRVPSLIPGSPKRLVKGDQTLLIEAVHRVQRPLLFVTVEDAVREPLRVTLGDDLIAWRRGWWCGLSRGTRGTQDRENEKGGKSRSTMHPCLTAHGFASET